MTEPGSTYDNRQPFPAPLISGHAWHYTGTAGLHGIWHEGVLWASATRVLNDSREVDFGIDAIQSAWVTRKSSLTDKAAIDFIGEAITAVAESALLLKSNSFVLSASLNHDLLNQWMHYGGAEGYALGLTLDRHWDAKARLNAEPATSGPGRSHSGWFRVEYEQKKQSELISNAINWLLNNHRQLAASTDGPPFAKYVLSTISLLLKHPAFAAEEEVRFICSVNGSELELIQYRVSDGHLVPYVSIAATEIVRRAGAPSGLGIDEIRCGPNVSDTAAAVLQDMTLVAVDYPKITRSNIPHLGRA